MPLFGRKKREIPKEELLPPPIEEASELVKQLEKKEVEEGKVEDAKREISGVEGGERSSFAPLFVRLNRYKQILSTMNYLKNTINMVKSALSVLNELDKMREQNLKMVQGAIDKVEEKMLKLDSEFMRPSGFVEEIPEVQDVEIVEATLSDLKGQIDQLKSEIEQMT